MRFCGHYFAVTPDVLRPYKATERLVEAAIERLRDIENPFFCDVGTGSGNVVVSILKALPKARAIAVDISPAALFVARWNAWNNGVSDRVTFVASDALDAIDAEFDLIVCNPPHNPQPPYITQIPFAYCDGGKLEKKIEKYPHVLMEGFAGKHNN